MATERVIDGDLYRVIRRDSYGSKFAFLESNPCGSYEKAFVPTVQELFQQQPYQMLPDSGKLGPPMFLDFTASFHTNATGMGFRPRSRATRDDNDDDDEMLWCVCTHNRTKNLENITVMTHKPSGIHVVVGGTCANHMLGLDSLDEIRELLRGEEEGEMVCRLIDAPH